MIGCYVSGVVIETLNVASESLDPSRLPDDVPLLREVIGQLLESLKQTQGRADRLEHRLGQLLRARFGPRSEKLDVAQLTLFAAELIGQAPTETAVQEGHADESKSLGCANPTRGGHGRQRLPKDLPRRRVEHELAGDTLACPCCGGDRVRIGQEVSEQLEYVPASVYVLEHVRGKYACRRCEGEVVVADKPTQPIEKGLAGPGLLAATIVNKYSDHLPLYRQEKIFKRHGVTISRSTTCGWMRDCAALVKPLVDLMSRRVKQSKVIHTDDTPVPPEVIMCALQAFHFLPGGDGSGCTWVIRIIRIRFTTTRPRDHVMARCVGWMVTKVISKPMRIAGTTCCIVMAVSWRSAAGRTHDGTSSTPG